MSIRTKVGKTVNGTKIGDKLTGTSDNDIFRGGAGDDVMTGGGGKDTFIFEASRATNGLDTITDFASITKAGSAADLLDLSLAVTAKNISNNTIGNYVWIINGKLYVDGTGAGIAGGKGVVWANLPGLVGGEKVNVRTVGYDGPLDVLRFDAPALKLQNDTGASNSDRITQDPLLAKPTNTVGTVQYSLDGTNWSTSYTPPTADGTYTVYARQTYDGVTSAVSELTFTLDTRIDTPTASLAEDSGDGSDGADGDAITQDGSLNISGPAEDVTREYSLDGGSTWTTTYDPSTLLDGDYTVQVRDTDKAGNSAQGSVSFTLDTTADADDDLAIGFDDDTVADADKGSIALTVTGLDTDIDPGQVTVTVTDKDGNTADAVYDAGTGKWLVDGSSLATGALVASVSVQDVAGNKDSASGAGTLLPGDITATDDWSDGYDDWDLPAGSVSLDGKVAAAGVIEVDGDVDLFIYSDAYGNSQPWWNGVYEITVTGELDTSKLKLGLESPTGPTPVESDLTYTVDFSISDSDTIVFTQDWNLPGSDYFLDVGYFTPGAYVNLTVGATAGQTGSYSVAINMIDDYSDTLDPADVTDTTADLGLGTIIKTAIAGASKEVTGLINYAGDSDFWKYEGEAGEQVSVRFNNPDDYVAANLMFQVLDSAGNEITASNGVYTLDGTTFIQVVGTGAEAGSNYALELFEPANPVQITSLSWDDEIARVTNDFPVPEIFGLDNPFDALRVNVSFSDGTFNDESSILMSAVSFTLSVNGVEYALTDGWGTDKDYAGSQYYGSSSYPAFDADGDGTVDGDGGIELYIWDQNLINPGDTIKLVGTYGGRTEATLEYTLPAPD